jgi:GH35 family endo-1,4-beta-xylanase
MRGDMEISRTGTAQQIADISRINPTLSERQSSPAFISDNGVKANKANEEGANFLLISNPFGPSTCGEVPGMNLQAQPPSLGDAPSSILQPSALSPQVEQPNRPGDWKLAGAAASEQPLSQQDGSLKLSSAQIDPQHGAVLSHRIDQDLPSGQGLDIHLKMRSSQTAPVTVEVVQSKEPYAQTFSEPIESTPGWQDVVIHGIAPEAHSDLSLNLKIDGKAGSFEFKDVSVVPTKALQTEPEHYAVDGGGNVTETSNSAHNSWSSEKPGTVAPDYGTRNGKPFVVGFEVQSLHPQEHSAAQDNIQNMLIDYATGATVTPYWDQWNRSPESAKAQIAWLENQKHILVKDHPAVWGGGNVPTDIPADWQAAEPRIKEHAMEIAKLPGQFTEINETADYNAQAANGVTNWIRHEGSAKATEEAIDWIRQADPNKTIIYNDYQNGALEMKMLDQLQKDNKLPDAIGIQLHMDQGEWPLERVEETVNKLAKYGKPIYITEISVLSGEHGRTISQVNHQQIQKMSDDFEQLLQKTQPTAEVGAMTTSADDANVRAMTTLADDAKILADPKHAEEQAKIQAEPKRAEDDVTLFKEMKDAAAQLTDKTLKEQVLKELTNSAWASTPEGEQRQADYTVNLYKLLHDNPHVQGITWWDMSDEKSWKLAPRGWFRTDGTPKPVVARMQELFKEWQQH